MNNPFRSVILLDKPSGPTSLECAETVRNILGAKKAGHAGTLDPAVTGVLVIALDEATKAMPVLMNLPKEYEGVMHIHRDFLETEIREAVKSLTGKIIQTPPVRSAVSRQPRERDVYSFEILRIAGRDVSFRVSCQAGTYIRKLCSDLGENMGTQAHMKSLVRTRVGPFSLKECVSLEKLEKSPERCLVPLEKIFQRLHISKVLLKKDAVQKVLNGSPVRKEHVQKSDKMQTGDYVGIYSGRKLIALGVAAGVGVRTERVFKD